MLMAVTLQNRRLNYYEGISLFWTKKITFKDVPEPESCMDDILVKIDAVGICGSDMHAYLGRDEEDQLL